MTLLAIECSSPRRSVAIAREGAVLAEAAEAGGRATALTGLIDEVLTNAGVPRDAVTEIALGLGPGSYTGIRAAIALALGWELALGTRLIGVSSVYACAWRCHARGLRGRVGVVVDAQRDEFYLEEFDLAAESPESTAPLRLTTREALKQLTEQGLRLAGPEVVALGFSGQTVSPDAAAIAACAFAGKGIVPGNIEPIYLRPTAFVKAPSTPAIPTIVRSAAST